MKPELRKVGDSHSPVVVIDEFGDDPEQVLGVAEALAPFPAIAGNHYPGVRRAITEADSDAYAYVERTLTAAAPYIGGGFDVDEFDLLEASFSMVTTAPEQLQPQQRSPHFDSTDQKYLAVLHYLRVPPATGTAFYRHRATQIERVTEQNVSRFVHAAKLESANASAAPSYITGSDKHFEMIDAVDAVAGRLIVYHGSLLHSGIIPPDMNRSRDPREGRLTANIFVRAK